MISRLLCSAALTMGIVSASAADAPSNPFGQAGSAPASTTSGDNIEFSGVSTVGKKTMINLYDKQAKRSFWVEAGKTASGVTVVKYDSAHDQVTIRQNGVEKLLPLRAPSAVVSGPATPLPTPSQPVASQSIASQSTADATTGPQAAVAAAPAPATPTTTGTTSMSQARQEEEARMLVSDLLEIGMAQRRAYEEAQRKAAAQGQQQQPQQQSAQPQPAPTGQTAQTGTPGQ